jgi:hypothetical protein
LTSGGLAFGPSAENDPVSEWVRLGLAVAAVVIGITCAAIGLVGDSPRTEPADPGRWAFIAAALLMVSCLPLELLDATGSIGSAGAFGLAGMLVGAAALSAIGRAIARRARMAPRPVRFVVDGGGGVSRRTLRGRVPAAWLSGGNATRVVVPMPGSGPGIELHQN